MQHAEGVLCNQSSAVHSHAAYRFGHPCGVAREELVIFLDAHELYDAQLHYELVDYLLRLELGEHAALYVALDIDIEECGVAADRHCRAVLLLHRAEIAEIEPLHGLFGVGRGAGDILAVFGRHFCEISERLDLLGYLLSVAHLVGRHVAV